MRVETTADGWQVTAPSGRFDIEREEDLIEEVARIFGYDKIPTHSPSGALALAIEPEARINELALQLVNPGGLLVSASCSMHLSRADLVACVQQAAVRTDCQVRIVEQGAQGPDHPIHPAIPETEYLKAVFVRKL